MLRPDAVLPLRVLAIVLFTVFAVELAIMLAVDRSNATWRTTVAIGLVDAFLLVACLCPVLWLLVVRPLRATIAERGDLLARVLKAQDDERARLAREIHDGLGQTQSAVLLAARSIAASATLHDAQTRASDLARLAAESIESARRIARGLAPGVLVDLGLAVAAERLCEDVEAASGLSIVRTITLGPERLAPETEFAAYRLLQEALTNCVRHAGATHVRVEAEAQTDALKLVVSDDGRGLSPAAKAGGGEGFGLRSMRERVVLLGGSFSLTSGPTRGTTVVATLPLARRGSGA